MPEPHADPAFWAPILLFNLYLGAAMSDATPAQRAALRATIRPLLDGLRRDGNTRPILTAIQSIMGAQWEPTGDWARQIDNFTRPSDA